MMKHQNQITAWLNCRGLKAAVSLMLALMLLCGSLLNDTLITEWSTLAESQEGTPVVATEQPAADPTPDADPIPEPDGKNGEESGEGNPPAGEPTLMSEDSDGNGETGDDAQTGDEPPAGDPPANELPIENPTEPPVEATDNPTESPAGENMAETPAGETLTDTPAEIPTQTPEGEAPTEEPTETPTEPPVDERAPLQRMIEDEGGAYVNVDGGRLYESSQLSKRLGRVSGGLAFAVGYTVREDGEDAVRVQLRTEDDEIMEGWLPASRATGLDRASAVESLQRNGETFELAPNLPLSAMGFEPEQPEESDPPAEQPEGDPTSDPSEQPADESSEPAEQPSMDGFVPADYEGNLPAGITENGDGLYTYLDPADESALPLLLVYGSAGGAESAFYLVDEFGNADLSAPFMPVEPAVPELDLSVEEDVPLLTFTPAVYEGELPAGVTANGDGTYLYQSPADEAALPVPLVYGSVDGAEPAFYPLYENGLPDLTAPFNLPAAETPEPVPEANVPAFIPMTPTELPDGYAPVQPATNEPESVSPAPAAFLNWLFPVARAEENFQDYAYGDVWQYQGTDGNTHYCVYGSWMGGNPAFYSFNISANELFFDENGTPIVVAEDDAIADSDLLRGPEAAPDPSVVDQALEVYVDATTNNQKTGADNAIRVMTKLATTDQSEYVVVTLPLSDLPAGATFPDFESGDTYTIINSGESFVLTLKRDDNGIPVSVTYCLEPGDEFTAYIKVKVPNGTTENGATMAFGTPTWEEGTFTGNVATRTASLTWKADFQWDDITVSASPSRLTLADGATDGAVTLSGPITWKLNCRNAMDGQLGVLFTSEYTVGASMTLPTGVSFPAGTGELSDDGMSYSINGVVVATFDKPVESCRVEGDKLYFTYHKDNDTLNDKGDPAEGKTAADMEDYTHQVTLNANTLVVDEAQFVEGSAVKLDAVFEAHACKGAQTDISQTDVSTPIYDAVASFSFRKTNSPASGQTISSTDTFIEYTLTATNNSARTQTVTVSDTLPAGLVYASDSAHLPTEGVSVTGSTVKWKDITLKPGQTQTFTFYAKVAEGTANGTRLSNRGQMDTSKDENFWSNTVYNTFDASEKLVLRKNVVSVTSGETGKTTPAASSIDVVSDDTVTYRIQVTNASFDKDSEAYVITDTMPDGLVLTEAQLTALQTAYPGATYNKDTNVFTLPLSSVPHNNAANPVTFMFDATVTKEFPDNFPITNTAEIMDLGLISTANVRYVTPKEKWTLDKSASVTTVTKGDTFAYTLKINNTSTVVKAHDLTDKLPDGISLADGELAVLEKDYPGATYDAATGLITIPGLTVHGESSVSISFDVVVTGDGFTKGQSIKNTAEVKDLELTADATVTFINQLQLAKTADRTSVYNGDVINWTVTIQNNGTTDAVNQTLTDTLPYGVVLTDEQVNQLKVAYPSAEYDRANRTLTITGLTIPAKGALSIAIPTTVDATATADGKLLEDGTSLTNTAVVGGEQATTSVKYEERRAIVNMAKTAGSATEIGDLVYQIPYTLKVTNKGESTEGLLEPLVFRDVMSGGLYPPGAGDATEGTIDGLDNLGKTVKGTWTRTGYAAPYTYTILWEIPALAAGEEYIITYTGEVKGDPSKLVNATNNATITGSVEGNPGGGTVTPIQPKNTLTKTIRKVDSQTPASGKSCTIYPGQKVEYTVTLDNTTSVETVGALTDTLPAIRAGSTFQWEYGTNVTASPAPDGGKVENGQLIWSNVTLQPGESQSMTITLQYPLISEFAQAFGSLPTSLVNAANYLSNDGTVSLRDSVTHSAQRSTISLSKSVNRDLIDVSKSTGDERVAIWTIFGFGTAYPAENLSLLDNLDDVRNRFKITAIDFGGFTVRDFETGLARGYTLTLTFNDGTTVDAAVGADNVATVSYPTGKSVADVAAVRWDFGNVRSLTVWRNPTITTTVKDDAYPGSVLNRAFLYCDGRTAFADTDMQVINSDILSKRLLHSDGTLVDNEDACAVVGERLIYEVTYANLYEVAYNMKGVTFTDTLQTLGLDVTKDIVVRVRHTSISGTVADPVLFADGSNNTDRITIPASDWRDDSFTLTIGQGTMELGDELVLTYVVTTSSNFYQSANNNDTFALKNKMVVGFADGREDVSAECGPFRAQKVLKIRLQKSVVGFAYDNHFHYNTDLETMSGQAASTLVASDLAHISSVASDGKAQIIYGITITNSKESNVNYTFWYIDETPNRAGMNSSTKNLLGQNIPYYFAMDRIAAIATGGPIVPSYYLNSYEKANDDLDCTRGKGTFNSVNYHVTGDTIGFGKFQFNNGGSRSTLMPGQSFLALMVFDADFNSYDSITNTVSVKCKAGDDFYDNCPAGTKIEIIDDTIKVPTFGNEISNWNSFSTMSDNNGDCVWKDESTLKSSVTVEIVKPSIGIEKETVGFFTPDDYAATGASSATTLLDEVADTYLEQSQATLTIRDPSNEACQPEDYVCWIVKVTNPTISAISGYEITDEIPAPYYAVAHGCFIYNSKNELLYSDTKGGTSPTEATEAHTITRTGTFSTAIPAGGYALIPVICKVRDGASAQYTTYTNTAKVVEANNTDIVGITDGVTLYSDRGNIIGAEATADIAIGGRFGTKAVKTVTNKVGTSAKGTDRINYVSVDTNEIFTYTLDVESLSTTDYKNFVLIDRLPTQGDSGAVNLQSKRGSAFDVSFAADPAFTVQVDTSSGYQPMDTANYVIEYKELASGNTGFTQADWAGTTTDWTAAAANADAFRLRLVDYNLPSQAKLRVTFQAKLTDPDSVSPGEIAWNTFGYRYATYDTEAGLDIPVIAEPTKVGVQIPGAYLSLTKQSAAGRNLSGAEFTIYETWYEATGTLANAVETITTNTSGKAQSSLLSKQIYYVKETKAPDGYMPSDKVFTVDLTNAATNAIVAVNGGAAIVNYPEDTTARLTLKKAFAEGTAVPEGGITLTVSGTFATYGAMDWPVAFTKAELQAGTAKPVENLIPGNTYTISEPDGGYVFTMTAASDADGADIRTSETTFTPTGDCTVTVTNRTPEPGTLKIRKWVVGADGGESFTIRVKGEFNDTTDRYKDFEITPDKRGTWIEVPGVKLGSVYEIIESSVPVSYTASYSQQTVIVSTGESNVTVTNTTKTPATLKLRKEINGVVPTDGTFTIVVAGSFTDTTDMSKTITLDAGNGYTATVSGVKVSQTYMVTETGYDADAYAPTYEGLNENRQITIPAASAQAEVTVTVNNLTVTKYGSITVSKRLTEAAEENATFSFALTGPEGATYTGTAAVQAGSDVQTVTWTKDGQPDAMTRLPLGTYTLKETSLDSAYSFKQFILGGAVVSGSNNQDGLTFTLTEDARSVQIQVENQRKTGSLALGKELDQPADADATFAFTLTGPSGDHAKTYEGTVFIPAGNAANTTAAWTLNGEACTLSALPTGEYVLTETLPANGHYSFQSYTLTGAGGSENAEERKLTFTLTENASVSVTASNLRNTGRLEVAKKLLDAYGNAMTSPAEQDLYIALYKAGAAEPVRTQKLEWDADRQAYQNAVFENLPYDSYTVKEMLLENGAYVAASGASGFPYTVTGDNVTVTMGADTAAPAATVSNTQQSMTANITAEKLFASVADKTLLEGKTFTIVLQRTDGEPFHKGNASITFTLDKNGAWKSAQSDVRLPAGEYEFFENLSGAAAEGWENSVLTGSITGSEAGATAILIANATFEVTKADYGKTVTISLTATNKAVTRPVSLTLNKTVDSVDVDATDTTALTFDFVLYHGADELAKGSITKTKTEAEAVTAWENGFDPTTYPWVIGDTYTIKEATHNLYQLDSITGVGLTMVYEGEEPNKRLTGASFTVAVDTASISLIFHNVQKNVSDITLQKKVLDADDKEIASDAWVVNTEFTFDLYNSAKTNIGSMALRNGEPAALSLNGGHTIRLGSVYYIKETGVKPAGAYELIGFEKADGTALTDAGEGMYRFVAQTGLQLVAKNRENPNLLRISKKQVGGGDGDVFEFTVTLNNMLYSGEYTLIDSEAQVKTTTDGKLTLSDGQTAVIYGLKANDTFKVVETPSSGYVATVQVGNGEVATTTEASGTISGKTVVAYTNTSALLDVMLAKQVDGNAASRVKDFTFTIEFRDKNNNALSADTLIAVVGGTNVSGVSAPVITSIKSGDTVTLRHGQTLTFQNLNREWRMRITEADYADSGYTTSFTDSFKTGADATKAASSTDWFDLIEAQWDSDKKAYPTRTFNYTNKNTIAVPTGILLDIWPYLVIVLAALAGGAWLLVSRKKKNGRKRDGRDDWE